MSNNVVTNLSIGVGSIDPDSRIAAGEITRLEVDNFIAQLQGHEWYDSCALRVVPNKCVDGRSRLDGLVELGPNAAGGSFTLVMADALINNMYRNDGQNATEHARNMYRHLISVTDEQTLSVGGHNDTNASADHCGCGAEDKLFIDDPTRPSIVPFIVQQAEVIRATLEAVGVAIDDDLHGLIVANAKRLLEENYVTSGHALADVLREVAGDASIETLVGDHHEVAVVLNMEADTTFNRSKAVANYGTRLQAFNVDIPAIQKSCELISRTPSEASQKFVAALYYNVATAAVLSGPSLRVIVRQPAYEVAC